MKKGSPLAVVVASAIRSEILNGKLAPGSALMSERSLAYRHSVSRTVVRDAIAMLSKEGLLAIKEHCRPVVADPSHVKRFPRGRNVGIWLWPYADDYTASSIFRGIQRSTQGTQVRLVMGTAKQGAWRDVLRAEEQFLNDLMEDEAAVGAILWYLGGKDNLPALKRARDHGLHLVFLDRLPPAGVEGDYVGTDNKGSALRVVRHLVELKHRRIACVTNQDEASSVGERILGYRAALEEAGIEFDESLVVQYIPDFPEPGPAAALRVIRPLQSLPNPPTAIFTINDTIALSFHDALRTSGLRVPEDISLAGFDGLLNWIPGGGPITTAVQDFIRMGEIASDMLFERLRGEPRPYRHVLLDAPLSNHASASLRKESDAIAAAIPVHGGE